MNTRVARQQRSRPTKYLKFKLPLKYLTSLVNLRGFESTRSPFNPLLVRWFVRVTFSKQCLFEIRQANEREAALESSPFQRLKGRRPETVNTFPARDFSPAVLRADRNNEEWNWPRSELGISRSRRFSRYDSLAWIQRFRNSIASSYLAVKLV